MLPQNHEPVWLAVLFTIVIPAFMLIASAYGGYMTVVLGKSWNRSEVTFEEANLGTAPRLFTGLICGAFAIFSGLNLLAGIEHVGQLLR